MPGVRPARTEAEVHYASVVGRNVHALRKARGMSSANLAAKLRETGIAISDTGIRRIELGYRPSVETARVSVSVDQLMAFSKVLGCTPDRLLTEVNCQQCNGAPPDGYVCAVCGATNS